MTQPAPHVVLLGDSVFDNARYVAPGPDVAAQLRAVLPAGWRATLRAVDGATTSGLAAQLRAIPADATHLVVSVGGNDALQNRDLLSLRVTSTAQALDAFARRLAVFEAAYRRAIRDVAELGRPTAVCTIYNGNLDDPEVTPARLGVALFNDVILRTALDLRVDTLELRQGCREPRDYANPIEPSVHGGDKIARAIAALVTAGPEPAGRTRAWGAA